jgi:hypothetical protein
MIEKEILKENLSKCVAKIVFNKTDGSVREMYCTLMSEHLPQQIVEDVRHLPRKQNDNVLAVWDIDNKGWRSFHIDSITNIEYIGVNRV